MTETQPGDSAGPSDFPATTPFNPPAPAVAPRPPSTRDLRIEFTASGSEYFRIWIVNLLLTLVTLGLYYPFAKARRLRYFDANTVIDGQALAFHGDPWRMFRGYVLLAVLLAAYSGGGRISPTVGLVAFVIVAAIWPALWRASLQFRLGNTSWRGLRFRFSGGLREAYLAYLPVGIPLLPYIGISLFFSNAQRHGDVEALRSMLSLVWILGLSGLGVALLSPWTFGLLKRYQHGHYGFAAQQTRLDLGIGPFYGLAGRIFGVTLGLGVLFGICVIPLAALTGARGGATPGYGAIAAFGVAYALFIAIYLSYATSRTQNLVWGHTRSAAIAFHSRLGATELLKLTLVNWLLTLVTLSLYRPFAAVATTRLRLAAMTIEVSEDVETWAGDGALASQDASGDAAADFFGFDIGL
ncbi:MAG: DUF898 domain-containing protein [Pelomonas sp.]|nr:DUF898 domain-containing protein [Roseateles sp.]